MNGSEKLKTLLGNLPLTAEAYWRLRGQYKPWSSHFKLEGIQSVLAGAVAEAQALTQPNPAARKVCVFATLHYWIEQSLLVALALSAQDHQVSFGYLPYSEWDKEINAFDLRKQDLYAQTVLAPANQVMRVVPLLKEVPPKLDLSAYPAELAKIIDQVSDYDTQYTLQVEETDQSHPLYALRHARNTQAALALYDWLQREQPQVLVVPNGTILEMGVAYQVARLLGIKAITFEFADQRERIWLAQDGEIMSHDTSSLWADLGNQPLPDRARTAMLDLFAARKNARLWGNFARQWQKNPVQGSSLVRQALGLDGRPLALLATNVLGDSLTLGRQRVTATMAEWVVKTIAYFANRPDAQLVVRVHPGELLTHGTSIMDVISQSFPTLPANIHVVAPDQKINTYDLVETADLGLVFTTTVGMEMAMAGLPVIVAGKTHYAEKGFTRDPQTWEGYEAELNQVFSDPAGSRLDAKTVDQAWLYAYLFFFEFSLPFPWHLLWLKEDFNSRPMRYVLSPAGQARYAKTFAYLAGEPLVWKDRGLARLTELGTDGENPHAN